MPARKKINLALVFGGKSAEHEVSLQSARNVFEAIDKTKYRTTLILIDKSGDWFLVNKDFKILDKVALIYDRGPRLLSLTTGNKGKLDVAFPVLHGTFGEDGTIQGLFEMVGLPYVGAGVLGSAVGMDKEVTKQLLVRAGLPTPKFLIFHDLESAKYSAAKKALGRTVFVKPANLGSSVGVSKATNEKEFRAAAKDAFRFDKKIIVEQAIKGREVECSVLGNEQPRASLPGEIISKDFYTYEAKYVDDTSTLIIPAKLTKNKIAEIRKIAVRAYKTLDLEGMSRVDFFVRPNGSILINEVNTIPGFTNISMYPKLWAVSGLKYSALIDRLIQLAFERHDKKERLRFTK